MSGRVRVTLADGRKCVGFRTTLKRRAPAAAMHRQPDWRLTITLPRDMRFIGLASGDYPGMVGVSIGPLVATVTGKRRSWVLEQGCALIRDIAPGFDGVVGAVLSRDPAPEGPPIADAPFRQPAPAPCQLRFDRREVVAAWARHCQVIAP